jgi:hypothetical protein
VRIEFIAAVLMAGCPAMLSGQGFTGKFGSKTTIVLNRKLPAAVTLKGKSFAVKVAAVRPQDPCQKMVTDKLQSTVETAIIRYNSELQLDPDKPDTVISVKVVNCNAVATPEYTTALTGKNKGQQQQTGVKVNGDLTVAYQARTRAGATVDAEPIDVKYKHEFNNVNSAVSGTKNLIGKLPLVGKKHSDDDDNSDDPHTKEDILQIMVNRVTERIAARLVNTNEKVEVRLARGSMFDEDNRLAEAARWSQYVEAMETMTPLPKPEDDSYRLYNIGVGDEALGYKAETPAGAKAAFEKAVIQYRKAGEANPHEKYFIEPVNRIEIALEHYRKLSTPAAAPKQGTGK